MTLLLLLVLLFCVIAVKVGKLFICPLSKLDRLSDAALVARSLLATRDAFASALPPPPPPPITPLGAW